MEVNNSDEQYIITEAQKLRNMDACAAKAWIITAKTLFPNNFNVQVSGTSIRFPNINDLSLF